MLPRDFGQFKLIWSTVRQVQVENFTPSCNSTGHTLELKFQHGPEEGRVSLTSAISASQSNIIRATAGFRHHPLI
ncbi:hypothetical protein PC128_g10292 [Phytophthora cactorum]|nr:hypothetical protein PC128_g10292 [Phytophthora cactorum]